MTRVHLNMGSNSREGKRLFLSMALLRIAERAGRVVAVSDIVESAPWGFESDSAFVNIGVDIATPLPPLELLDCLQGIERDISAVPHRNADGSYRDRDVDIDIILYGELRMESERLTVPHPLMYEREFVLRPLEQLRGRRSRCS